MTRPGLNLWPVKSQSTTTPWNQQRSADDIFLIDPESHYLPLLHYPVRYISKKPTIRTLYASKISCPVVLTELWSHFTILYNQAPYYSLRRIALLTYLILLDHKQGVTYFTKVYKKHIWNKCFRPPLQLAICKRL